MHEAPVPHLAPEKLDLQKHSAGVEADWFMYTAHFLVKSRN